MGQVLGTYMSAALTGKPEVVVSDTSAEDAYKARIAELEAQLESQLEGTLTPEVDTKSKGKAAVKATEVPEV